VRFFLKNKERLRDGSTQGREVEKGEKGDNDSLRDTKIKVQKQIGGPDHVMDV